MWRPHLAPMNTTLLATQYRLAKAD